MGDQTVYRGDCAYLRFLTVRSHTVRAATVLVWTTIFAAVSTSVAQAGAAQAGAVQAGAVQAGAVQAGTMQAGPADPALDAVQLLRQGGCGGLYPAARSLHHDARLDRAAQRWAAAGTALQAAARSDYELKQAAGLHVRGPTQALVGLLKSYCTTLVNAELQDMGSFRRLSETWIILAAPGTAKPAAITTASSLRVLQLVNEARARGARCGGSPLAPVPAVRPSQLLNVVALGHALDMAQHQYFEHEDRSGRSPADRVRAAGYAEKLVGENIAYGVDTAEEVVQGWLDSPGHCENIMNGSFAEMGIALAPDRSRRALYWVQLLAAPRT